MTFNQWVAANKGKQIDYDGVYGVQCVDLIKSYIKNVLGVEPQSIGNAIDYWNKRDIPYIKKYFVPMEYKKGFAFQQGDIIVMQGSGKAGHIAVVNGKGDGNGVYAYDENYGGTHAGMTLRYFAFDGKYKIVGILRPKKVVDTTAYTKILLIGNSYTYYNGYGEMLSRLCAAAKHGSVVVVRATKGGKNAHQLMSEKLDYKAWVCGKVIAKGTGTLAHIGKIDFASLGRSGKWDYIVCQNNATIDKTCQYDVELYNYVKGWIPSAIDFIINVTHFGKSLADARLKQHKEAQKICKCSLIDERGFEAMYQSVFTTRKWVEDLTIQDKNYHASARGMYLNALATYAKIFGYGNFSKDGKTIGIPLYNPDNKSAKGYLVNDKWHKGNSRGNSIGKTVAAMLQYLVRKYASTYIGTPIAVQKPTTTKPTTTQKPKVKYFPAYKGKSTSLVDALNSLKYDSSYAYRKKIAKANSIKGYTGLPFQNTKMLALLKKGKLIKP